MDVPLVKVLTPDLTIDAPKRYAVVRGPSMISQYNSISNSYNTSTINFNFPTPSPDSIIKRNMLLQAYVELTFAGSGTGNLLQIGVNDAPRAKPLSKCMTTVNAILDNATCTVSNLQDFSDALDRYYLTPEQKAKYSGMTPVMQDQFQDYADWVTYGGARNPLASYGNSSELEDARGGFSGLTVVSNTNTSAVVRLAIAEPFSFLPPFIPEDISEDMGFVNVQQFTFQINLSDLSYMWSHSSAGNTISSVTATFYQAPSLAYTVVTPPLTMKIPKTVKFPYSTFVRFPQSDLTLASGASQQIQYQNIQLNSIPTKIFLFAFRRPQDRTYNTSESYATIENVNVQFNNVSGILSGASKRQLYAIAVENGIQLTWNQFDKYVGSVMCLEFGKDIFLNDTEAPGKLGTYQLQPVITFKNASSATVVYTPYCVVQSEGIFTIHESGLKTQDVGTLTGSEILNAPVEEIKYSSIEKTSGAGFGSSALQTALKAAKVGLPVLNNLVQMVPDDILGSGYSGGAKMSREELRRKK